MNLPELKESLKNHTFEPTFIVFRCEDNSYIADKYIDCICNECGLTKVIFDDIMSLYKVSQDTFTFDETTLYILYVDTLDEIYASITSMQNCIIVCNKVDKEIEDRVEDNIIEVYKLKDWAILEYAKIKLAGVNPKKIEWLCANIPNIYRLDSEMDKINIFDEAERDSIFNEINNDDGYCDIVNYNAFSLINAIVKKDKVAVKEILKAIEYIDFEPMAFAVLLCRQFRNMAAITLNPNKSAEDLGLSAKQYQAIKYSCKNYSVEKIVNSYRFLCEIDYRVKSGLLDTKYLLDYIICTVMR